MDDISSYMARLRCESNRHFANARSAAARNDWQECGAHLETFARELELHFNIEESILFPAFEEETDGDIGLTRHMALEHLRMRDLIGQLLATIHRTSKAEYLSCAVTLNGILQHHNASEEQFLYPMIDDLPAEQRTLLRADIDDLLETI
jgi:iron-sulfur cluster repair protein YtfE (RIC family)